MRQELIPIYPGRPPVVKINGQVTYLSMHDQEFFRLKRLWKRRLAASHPDHGRTVEQFQRENKAHQTWLYRERVYYWRLGKLMPPDWSAEPEPPSATWWDLKVFHNSSEPPPRDPLHPKPCTYWHLRSKKCSCGYKENTHATRPPGRNHSQQAQPASVAQQAHN